VVRRRSELHRSPDARSEAERGFPSVISTCSHVYGVPFDFPAGERRPDHPGLLHEVGQLLVALGVGIEAHLFKIFVGNRLAAARFKL